MQWELKGARYISDVGFHCHKLRLLQDRARMEREQDKADSTSTGLECAGTVLMTEDVLGFLHSIARPHVDIDTVIGVPAYREC
jgi:hypothetical protein